MSLQVTHLFKIMAFLEKIYATDQKCLCFPVMQNIVYTKEQFDLLDKDPVDGDDAKALLDISTQWYRFSQIADQVIDPSSAIASTVGGNSLSDVYEDIVDPLVTDFAKNTNSTETENVAYANAMKVLYADESNSRLSEKWMSYKACKAALEMAVSQLKSRGIDVSLSNDPAVVQAWLTEQAELEKTVKDAEEKWKLEGFKNEIEQAIIIKNGFEGRSPAARQEQLRAKLEKFSTTDIASRDVYLTTSYSPRGLAGTNWAKHRITGDMLRKISVNDNPRLKVLLDVIGGDNPEPSLQEISFEIAECKIYRPWAEEDIFNMPYWKFKDPGKMLSDGASTGQASGECPAYISGLVFVRDIELSFSVRPRIPVAHVATTRFGPFSVSAADLSKLQKRSTQSGNVRVHDHRTRPASAAAAKQKPKSAADAIRWLNSGRLQSKAIATPRPAWVTEDHRNVGIRSVQAGTHTETFLQNEAQVFAFVCKPLLKSPNPGDNYLW